jgi:MFS superfamily sulfate permease-like transporter
VALSLFVGQLGRLTAVPIDSRGLLRPLLELAGKTAQIHGPTLVLGLGLFVLLRLLQRVAPRVPGPLVALLLAIALSWSLGLPDLGLAVVGPVPAGLPAPDLPVPSGLAFEKVLAAALGVFLVAFSSGIVTARTFVARTRERVDANRELVGFGTANLAAGLFGGFAVTGASSRTAVNLLAGAQTQLAGLIAAAALALALLFLTAPLALLPTAALGAILASAAVDLFDLPGLRRLWRVSRPEFAFAMLAVAGVVLLGALEGVAVAVAATLLHLLVLSARPRDALLGRIPGRGGFHKLHQKPAARPVPGMVIYAPQGSLLFFSADHIRRRILWIARQQPAGTRWFLIDAAAVPLIDTSAADMLDEVRDELAGLGMSLCFAKLHARPLRTLRRTGLVDRIGPEQVFSRLGAADATLAAR